MQIYYYSLCLLAFNIILINAKYVYRSTDNEQNKNMFYSNNDVNHAYRRGDSKILTTEFQPLEVYEDKSNDDVITFGRLQKKAIFRGDPREFIG
ncbi:unnamed protein product [Adineta steineri]|uniref:Uncharacterized protein n=1 Tax=Adineta steineri TaxID=433720 RepID=A0A815IPT4_9BILA|nr:unnamed protein product [Adineta steineri]CAF3711636.1 unnamed protein product [Adineta steineri]